MSIALSEFWTRLVRSGITDATGCKQLAAAYSKANQGTPPSDSETLANYLMEVGSLTSFQADALLADPPRDLRSGHYLIRSDRGPIPLSRWIPVSRLDDGRTGVLYRIPNDQLIGGRDQWLQAHQEVAGDGLQRFEYETQQAWTLVFSELPEGRCLNERLENGETLDAPSACKLGIAVAGALEAMHQRPLVHGSVQADHVWMSQDGAVTLLRDPSGPPIGIGADATDRWIDVTEKPEFYAAPESTRPDQVPTCEADIYSLGCLLFRLVAGRYPIEGASAQSTLAAHATEMPSELTEAIAKGETGDPFYRVIAFAMAKSPSARFASVAQLSGALNAILPLVGAQDSGQNSAPVAGTGNRTGATTRASASSPKSPMDSVAAKDASSRSKKTAQPSSNKPSQEKSSKAKSSNAKSSKATSTTRPSADPGKENPRAKKGDKTGTAKSSSSSSSPSTGKKAKTQANESATPKSAEATPSKLASDRSKAAHDAPTVPMHPVDDPTRAVSHPSLSSDAPTAPMATTPSESVPTVRSATGLSDGPPQPTIQQSGLNSAPEPPS
ncbi:MAG: serine/threonine protein kinase, partial [Rubripirellula sp.]